MPQTPTTATVPDELSDRELRISWQYRWVLMLLVGLTSWLMAMLIQPSRFGAMLLLFIGIINLWQARFTWSLGFLFLIVWMLFLRTSIVAEGLVGSHYLHAVLVVVYLSLCARYSEAARFQRAYPLESHEGKRLESVVDAMRTVVSSRWHLAILVSFAALVILVFNPDNDLMIYRYGLEPQWGRLIFIVLGMGFLWMICHAAISMLARYRATQDMREVEARALVNSEFWRDQSGIEVRLARLVSADPKYETTRDDEAE
ncbi:MAG: hypothetical protein AAFN77_22230 [Planctomycetota bacterium]